MSDAEKESALNDLSGRLASAGAPGGFIQAIIAAIMALLGGGNCPTPAPVVSTHPTLARLRIRAALRDQGVPFMHMEPCINAVVAVTTAATPEDVARAQGCVE